MNKTITKKMEINELFENDGKFYLIKPTNFEPKELHMARVDFIFKNLNKIDSLNELIKLSIIWSNIKNYNCEYDEVTMAKIDDLLKN